MADVIVVDVNGEVLVERSETGEQYAISENTVLSEGDSLIIPDGSTVRVSIDGIVRELPAGQTVTFPFQLDFSDVDSDDEFAAFDESLDDLNALLDQTGDSQDLDQDFLDVLAGDDDILESLEATAAGLDGGGGAGGSNFVRVDRINESVDPVAFEFEQSPNGNEDLASEQFGDGGDEATDISITLDAIPLDNDSTPTLSGSTDADPGSTVTLTVTDSAGNVQTLTTTVQADGTFSVDVPAALAEGEYSVEATVTDAAGNTATDANTGEIDTTAPVIALDAQGTDNDTTPTLSGTTDAAPGSTVTLTVTDSAGNVQTLTTTVQADGTFSVDVPAALAEGEYSVEATVTDAAGNTATDANTGEIDTTAPVIALDAQGTDNDTTPTLSGTTDAAPGSTVTLTVTDSAGNVQTLTTTVQADGTFSVDVPAALAEGEYSVEATVTDAAGNTATDANTGEIDTSAPIIALEAQGTDNDTTPTLSGTTDAAPGSTVTLTVTDSAGNVQTLTTTVQADGSFSVDVPNELAEGEYSVEATVTDAAGNTATDANTGEIDTTAPAITLEAQGTDNDTTPTLSGTTDAAPGSTVTLTVTDSAGNVQTLTTTVQADGTFSVDVPAALAEGEYSVEATVTDAAGNTATDANTGEIDTTAPVIALDAQGTDNDTTPTLSGTTDATPGSTIILTVTDSAGNVQTLTTTVQADGTFSVDVPDELAEGEYSVEATVTDAAGNTATDANTGEIDTTAPAITLEAQGTDNDTTPTLSGTTDAAPGSTVTLTVTDSAGNVQTLTTTVQADGTFSVDVPAALAEGEYSVEATVTDAAGNTATDANTGEIDTTAPAITLEAQGTDNDTTPTLSGTTDAAPGSTVTLTVTDSAGNVQTLTTTVQADGTFSVDVPAALAEGEYSVEATVTDAAGNTATDANTGEIDTTAPVIALDAQGTDNDTTPTLSGTTDAAPGSSVTLTVTDSAGNVQTLTTTVQADGSFSIDVPAALAEGEYSVEATVTDAAGNTATDSFNAEIDITGPTISLNDPGINGDATPTISGLTDALPGSTITFTVTDSAGNTQTFSTVVDPNGTFSVNVPIALADGTFEVSASVEDGLGNTSEATASGDYNAASPSTIIEQPAPTNDTTPPISGETDAPAGSEVVIVVTDSEGNEQIITATVGADGTFSEDVPTELSDGEFTVDVTVTTPDGNSSSSSITGEVDTTAPTISLDAIGTTNDDTPIINGSSDAEIGSEVTIEILHSDGSTQTLTAIVQADGSFSVEVPLALADGDFTVNATVTDTAGNTSSTSINAAINIDGPTIVTEPSSPTNGSEGVSGNTDTPNSDVVVVVTDDEGNSQTVSGSTDENGDFTVDLPDSLDDGEYTVEVTVTDGNGNSSTTTTTTVIDTTAPVISIDPQTDTNDATPTISGNTDLPEGSEITITVTDSEGNEQIIIAVVDDTGNFTTDVTNTLSEGEYTITVTAADEAGNTTTITETGGNVDTTEPALSIDPLTTENDGTPSVSGSTDLPPGSTVTLTVTDSAGNEQTITAIVDEDGNFNAETTTPLTEGEFSVEATVTDDAGNTTTVTETGGSIDTQAPTVSLNPAGIGNDNTPTISGTTDLPAGSEVSITVTDSEGNTQTFSASVESDGSFSANVPSTMLDGNFTIEATATDSAGNAATATETGIIDTNAPALTLTPLDNDNDTTPTISGTTDLPAGSTLTLTVTDALGNTQTFTAVVDTNGNFSAEVPSPLAEGDYNVTATATDASGNTASTTETGGNVDVSSPLVNLNAQGSTNDATPTITGTTDQAPGSTVSISVTDSEGNSQTFTTTVDANGTFSVDVPASLADGEFTVTASVSDDAGNQDTASTNGTIDTAAPTLSLDSLINDNDTTPAISGTSDLPEGSTVTLVITDGLGNQQTIEVSVDENGNFSTEVPSALAEGDYNVTATATDPNGNTASTTETGGAVDTTAPIITLVEQGTGNDATPTLSGTSDLPQGSIVTLTVTDSVGDTQTINALVDADGSFSIDVPQALAEGDYTVTATAQDEAGNQTSVTQNGSIDTNAPTLSLNPLTENNDNTPIISGATNLPEGSTVSISVTDNDGNTQTFTADVDAQGNFSAEVPNSLPDGDYTVTVNATDSQGNTATVTETGGVIDTTSPTLSLNNLGTGNDTTPTLSGNTDLPEGSLVSLQVTDSAGNVQSINALVDADGNFSVDVPSDLADGDYSVEASATDANGNSETVVTTGTVDATAPELTLTPQSVTNDTTPTISGTTDVEPGALVTITVVDSDGNSQTFQASVQGDGSFEASVPNALTDGDYTITATVTDTNGNQAIETVAGGSVDSQAPTLTINSLDTGNDNTPTISGNTDLGEGSVVVITVTDSNGDAQTINALVDDSGNFITDVLTPLAEGDYTVSVTATDEAGNTATQSETGGNVDLTAPVLSLSPQGTGNDTTPSISGNTDLAPGSLVTLSVTDSAGNTQTFTAEVDTEGNFNADVPAALAEGDFSVTATATDNAGNAVTTNENSGSVDTTPPAAPTINAGNGTEITGTAEPGTEVNIDVDGDGTPDYTVTVDGDGNWSVTPDTPLVDGVEVTATATDEAGNESAPTADTVDATAPVVTINDVTTNDTTPALTGTVNDPTATVVVTINGNDYTATNNGDGTWTLADDVVATLAEDSYTATVTATDADNNSATSTGTVVIDTTAPAAPTINAGNGTEITGTAEPGTEVNIDVDGDGTPDYTVTVDGDGNWSVTPDTPLVDGVEVTATATDEAGNESAPTADTVDATAPVVTINDVTTNDTTPALTGTINDPTATVVVTINGNDYTATNNGDGTWTLADDVVATLAEDSYTATVTATDTDNNSATSTGTVVIDTTPPAAPTVNAGNGTEITGTAEPGTEVNVDVDGDGTPDYTVTADGDGNWSVTPDTPLVDGIEVTATATDEAGNESTPTADTVDATAPVVTINDVTTNDTTPALTGTVNDPTATVVVTINGNDYTATNNGDGTWILADDVVATLTEDSYTAMVTATDTDNNSATSTGTVVIDTTPPAAPTINAGNGTEITGTAEPGTEVNIDVDGDGTPDYTVTVDGDGNWSVTPDTPLVDGVEVTATATDEAGNESAPTADTVDATAPVVTINDVTTNDTTPALTGTVNDPTATVVVTINGNDYTATNNGDGTWTLADDVVATLTEDTYTATVTATDTDNNSATSTGTVVIDTTAPAAPTINAGNGTEITGTAEPGTEVNIDVDGDGTPDYTVTVDGDGNWSVTPDTPLVDGVEVTATATDAAGNESAPTADTVDATAPVVTINDVTTNDTTPALTGTINDPTATVVVTINGNDYTATNNGDGTWTLADDVVATLAEDSYTATVTATDTDNNSATSTGTVVIDTTAPAAPTVNAGNGTEITGTAEPGTQVNVDVDGDGTPDYTVTADGDGNWSVTPDTPLVDGVEVTATATDAAGNESTPTADTVDATAPVVTINDVTTNDTTPALTGTVNDPTATVVVTINGNDYTATNNGDGTWTLADDAVATLTEDSYTATVTATDTDNNSATSTGTVVIDTTAPAAPTVNAGNGTEITGTAEPGTQVNVDVDGDGTPDYTVTVDGDGNWSVTPDTPLVDGVEVTATATDEAGNESAPTADTVDATAPVITINDVTTNDTTPALTGTINDPTATVVVTINGNDYTATNNGDGTWTLADDVVGTLTEDSYTATVTATDADNNSATSTGTVVIDTTAPAAPTVNAGNGTEITGTAEPGTEVNVDVDGDGTPDYTVTVDGDGNWSVTPDTPLVDGVEVTATATDAAGNESTPTADTVDATAPVVTINDVTTNDTTPELTGTINNPTATVVVTINGNDYTATNNGDGTWTLADDVVATLTEDSYTATVTATDTDNNSATSTGTVVIDITAPAAPTVNAGNGTEITGTAEPGTEVNIDVDGDGTPDYTVTADGDGNWSVTPDTPLVDGVEVTATATDAAGNESAPTADTVDATAPVVTINDVTTNDTTPALTGTVNDPTATVVVTINGNDYTATNNGDGTWTLADDVVATLVEDSYTATVTATDADNNSATSTGTVMIDTTPPAAPTINAGNGTEITGTAEPGTEVNVDVDGDGTPDYTVTVDGDGNWSVTPDTPLVDGVEVTATATDAAGNESAPTADTVDATAPVVTINDVTTNDTTPALTGTINDPTATVVVTINGNDYTATNNGDGTWTLADDVVATLTEDSYTATVTATDTDNNSATSTGTVVIDTTAPAAPTVNAGNGTEITGTAEPGTEVNVDVDGDGTPDYTVTVDGDGNWSVTPDTPLVDGVEVTATATDEAGNESAPTADTVDATAPVVTINDVTTNDTTPALTGTVNDPTATVVVTINGNDYTATNNGDGTWTLADDVVATLAEDSYTATVTATDADNNSATATGTVVIDTTAPAAPTVNAGNGTEITGTAEPNTIINIDVDGDGTPDYTVAADGDGNWSVTPDTPLVDGVEVTATATDEAGNESTPTADTVDATAPVVTINDVTTNDTTPALTGTINDPTATVVVTINGNDYTATNNGDGTWILADDVVATLTEDSYTATVTATDTDNNSATSTGTVVIDTTAPAAPTINAGNGTEITGTAEPGTEVNVDVDGDGTPDYTVTADGDGNWSVTPDAPLVDGVEVTATVTDAAGNESAPTADTVDATAPVVTINDVTTNDTTPALTGTVNDPNATVVVTINGNDYTATNNGDGTWILADDVVATLAEDSYTATVTATDTDNNSATATGTVVIDTTPPAAPTVNAGNGTEITGTAEPGTEINVDVDGDGTPDYTVTADGDGNWSVTPDTPLVDGVEVTATATDEAGNESAPTADTVDATAPVVTINDVTTNDTTPALTGTVNDPTATVVVTINGNDYTATNNGDGTWTLADDAVATLTEDSYTATVTATDTDNNSATATGTVVIDTTPPAAPTINAGNGTEITGTAEPGTEVNVDVDGDGTPDYTVTVDGDGNWSVTPDTPLVDGVEVTATATDEAGNESAPTADTVDATAPVITINDVTTNDTTPALTGTVNDPTATVVVTINGNDYTATNNGDGTWTLADDVVATLVEDSYTATVTATDADNNSATSTGTVMIDTTPPAAPTINAGNGTEITGTAEPGTEVNVDVDGDGTPDYTVTTDGDGNWSVTPDTPLVDGVEVTATATDEAGNESAPTADTVDATAPVVTINDVTTNDTTPALTGTVNDSTATVVVTINGNDYTATNNGDGTWTLADDVVATLTEDSYTATVTATDTDNNSATSTGTVVIDTTPPAAPTINAGNGTEITGTAEPGTEVNVDVDGDGTPDYTVTADGDGNWSVTPDTPLVDGVEVTATATDAAGNESAPTADTVDATAPVVTINDVTTNDTTPALTGTVNDSTATVVVTINGNDYTATNNGDGTWTLADDVVATLVEDTYTATVTATDTDNNSATSTGTVVIDTTPPAAPTINAGNGTEITGTAEPGTEVNVDVDGDGTPDYTVTVDGDGNWSVTPDTPLVDGVEVTATATDAAGNESAPTADTVDATAPVVTINDVTTNDTTPALTGTINDPTATVVVTINGIDYTATNNGDGTWILADDVVATLAEDSYTATVTATDADNNSATSTGTVVIDTTPPAAPTVNAGNGTEITGTAEPNTIINIDVDGDGTPDYTVTADGDGNWSVTPDTPLVDGVEVTATATDAAGNESTPTADTVDATAPVVTINDVTTNDTTPALVGAIDDPTAIVIVTINGNDYTATNNGDGTWTLADDVVATLAEGSYTATVTATDGVNNSSSVNGTVVIDTSIDENNNGQTVTFDSITNDSGVNGDFITSDGTLIFSGTVDLGDDSTLTVTVDGTDYTFGSAPELTIDGSGNWSLDLSGTSLPEGTYSVIATVTDEAGNSASTTSQDVVVQALDAINDGNTIDMGEPVVTVNPPQTTSDVQVIGLLESIGGVDASATFTVSPNNVGEVQIEVDQISLVAVADAYIIEVYDENGELVYQGVSADSQLVDVGGLDIFNVSGDESISISLSGLDAGNYSVVVRNDENILEELLDGDGNGDISLVELGSAGVVLGPDNQEVVLDTVETTLNGGILGIPIGSVGTLVRGALETILDTTTIIGAGDLVNALTAPLDALGLTGFLDDILSVIADVLLSNTLTLLQDTDITTTVTEYTYTGETVAQGNLIDGDSGGVGADTLLDGAQVTLVTNVAGESVSVPATGTTTIQGEYGVLEIAADGTYTYTADGDRSAIGQNEVFNYTLSDGETSDIAALTITISGNDFPPVVAQNDINDMELGAQIAIVNAPVTDSDTQVLGLLEGSPAAGSPMAGTTLTVDEGFFGEVVVEVSQNALVAVADAYTVEIIDAEGNVVATAMTPDNPLVGDVAGVNLIGVTGDDTLVVTFSGLPSGDYTVVVRNDESVLESLFDQDADGSITLTELGDSGVVLGAENQDVVLTAVEDALNGTNASVLGSLGLGTVVRELILEPALGAADSLGAGDLVSTITTGLNVLGLALLVDDVLDVVAAALLSNTLTLLQQTDVTSTLTEYAFEGSTTISGNVIDASNSGDVSDSIVQGGVVTQVTHTNGEAVTVLGSDATGVTISGDFGDLTIFEDGSYTYVANGVRDGLGDTDSFSYTISDGTNTSTANLNFNLSGQGVSADSARAELTYDFDSGPGLDDSNALSEAWLISIFGSDFSDVSNEFTVATDTTEDLTLTVSGSEVLSLGASLNLAVEMLVDGTWEVVETFSNDQLVGLLGIDGNNAFTVNGLTEGQYRVTMEGNTGTGIAGSISVDLNSTVHYLDQFIVDEAQTANGNLLENDVLLEPTYTLSVSTDGTNFQTIGGDTLLVGQYGTLQIDETGAYTYTPDNTLSVFSGTLTDTFTYSIEYPDGTVEQAEFSVFVTASGEGVPEVIASSSSESVSTSESAETTTTEAPPAPNATRLAEEPEQTVEFNANSEIVMSADTLLEETITLPEENDIAFPEPVTEVTVDLVDIDLPPEDLMLPSIEPISIDSESDDTSTTGSGDSTAGSSKEEGGDVGIATPTESDVLKTAIDKFPSTDI